MKNKHWVYVLLCKGNRFYTGYAVDVEKRFADHQKGKGAKFTRAFPPEKILCKQSFPSKAEALRSEYAFKQLSRPQKERALKEGSFWRNPLPTSEENSR